MFILTGHFLAKLVNCGGVLDDYLSVLPFRKGWRYEMERIDLCCGHNLGVVWPRNEVNECHSTQHHVKWPNFCRHVVYS